MGERGGLCSQPFSSSALASLVFLRALRYSLEQKAACLFGLSKAAEFVVRSAEVADPEEEKDHQRQLRGQLTVSPTIQELQSH